MLATALTKGGFTLIQVQKAIQVTQDPKVTLVLSVSTTRLTDFVLNLLSFLSYCHRVRRALQKKTANRFSAGSFPVTKSTKQWMVDSKFRSECTTNDKCLLVSLLSRIWLESIEFFGY